jgi:hypothetical protein
MKDFEINKEEKQIKFEKASEVEFTSQRRA